VNASKSITAHPMTVQPKKMLTTAIMVLMRFVKGNLHQQFEPRSAVVSMKRPIAGAKITARSPQRAIRLVLSRPDLAELQCAPSERERNPNQSQKD
jgi:hypothetical protein